MIDVSAERRHLIECAKGWIGTPYHTGAKLKGVGADCITWIAGAFEEAGLVPAIEIPFYPPDWHLHRDEERYLKGLAEWCVEAQGPPLRAALPGDIVVWRIGRCFAHGAIVADWPWVLHTNVRQAVRRANVEQVASLNLLRSNETGAGQPRPRKFFCLKRWAAP